MHRSLATIAVMVILAMACKSEKESGPSTYLRWVGDIAYDEDLDDPSIELCHPDGDVFQYHNVAMGLQYRGEKPAIRRAFQQAFKPVHMPGQSGLIRIRFVVNCKGETNRFRLLGADENWQAFTFHEDITTQLMAIAKGLDGWQPLDLDGTPVDYYQYLVFKMKDGEIIDIMP